MIIFSELRNKAKQFEAIEFNNPNFKIVSVGRMSPEKNMILCPYIAYFLKQMR